MPDLQNEVAGALAEICKSAGEAATKGAGLVCFPECYLQGYVSGNEAEARSRAFDLASPGFDEVLEELSGCEPVLVFGLIEIDEGSLFNTAVVVDHGQLIGSYRKTHPNEKIFQPGVEYPVFTVGDITFGINICADANFSDASMKLADQGADVILFPLNNMLLKATAERWRHRHLENLTARARETGAWIVSADVTGDSGDRVAYGCSAIIDPTGRLATRVPEQSEGMVFTTIEKEVGERGMSER